MSRMMIIPAEQINLHEGTLGICEFHSCLVPEIMTADLDPVVP